MLKESLEINRIRGVGLGWDGDEYYERQGDCSSYWLIS